MKRFLITTLAIVIMFSIVAGLNVNAQTRTGTWTGSTSTNVPTWVTNVRNAFSEVSSAFKALTGAIYSTAPDAAATRDAANRLINAATALRDQVPQPQ